MVKKSKLYTKTGDEGLTSLVSGTRVHKSNLRIDIYGDLDHLNSLIGFALSIFEGDVSKNIKGDLEDVQKNLFVMGSNMACELSKRDVFQLPSLNDEDVLKLERAIDDLDTAIPELKNFILPSGSDLSCRLHVCRTTARSLERKMANFDKNVEALPANYLIYLNRLSDYLFVASRFVNFKKGIQEINWP